MLETRLDWLQSARNEIYFPGEPYRTQEALCSLDAQMSEVRTYILNLNEEEFISEVELLEQMRRSETFRLPDSGTA